MSRVSNKVRLPNVSEEQIARAKEWDLFSYLQTFEPQELIQCGKNQYCTAAHDSLKISNGKWHWHSRGIGGKTALDYLIHVREMGFVDAVLHLTGHGIPAPPSLTYVSPPVLPKAFTLPKPNQNNARVAAYLLNRGIDREIINTCIQRKIIYESRKYNNCVFVGYDGEGTAQYAGIRSTFAGFRGEVESSDKRFSFLFSPNAGNKTIFAAESPIDALSYATMRKQAEPENWRELDYLSLGGTSFVALEHYLQSHPSADTVVVGLDNDKAGQKAAAQLETLLTEKWAGKVEWLWPEHGKDFNDTLLAAREKHTPNKTIEKER